MCSDGRHPPQEWGHLTLAQFYLVEGQWAAHIQAEGQPDKNYRLLGANWVDQEGVEVTSPEGVKWLNNRCFDGR